MSEAFRLNTAQQWRHALAATSPRALSEDDFWERYAGEGRLLSGLTVLDPFVGGGTTLVEAARLGAYVVGGDIDPLAVAITRHELSPPDGHLVAEVGQRLLAHLRRHFGRLYPQSDGEALHYFTLSMVTCPHCAAEGPLYKNLVLARDDRRPGAVVRDHALTTFCPSCFAIHQLRSTAATRVHCCGKYWPIERGTFARFRYRCPTCERPSTHRDLSTGRAPRRLLAVEVTSPGCRRWIREPTTGESSAIRHAEGRLIHEAPRWPTQKVLATTDARPHSFGIDSIDQLHTARQLLVMSEAFAWLERSDEPSPVVDALRLALSSALLSNNRLCGYAVEYGRLSPLFSVRGYSLPSLAVELNPLHTNGGRGTIAACIARVVRASGAVVHRHVWDSQTARADVKAVSWFIAPGSADRVICQPAADISVGDRSEADLVVFDPPYFDFISYDELSELQRAWLTLGEIEGQPLLPNGKQQVESFGQHLAQCMQAAIRRMKDGGILALYVPLQHPSRVGGDWHCARRG
jgi:putative DNA methylase